MARYVFSDLHAQTNLWEQIKNYIKEDDELFFSWSIIIKIYPQTLESI